ncbi:recombinase family protein [Kribbella shirazensis]|uniref:DNA invertase Pin-like site-specific DNA recombinase n=1 Tax=Kribbella shirazensis TaxID=1105143 RepID=A0A7X5V6X5_9ACTN|nr:recombinase family protein [Kribbella shirazensis]NIK55753.1 DNA invertase Pin-like site-specific DNA recombinase [Kribbella shirazensis]
MTRNEYADLYLRVSVDRPGQTAIERQEVDCRSWASEQALKVRRVHVDLGQSAYLDAGGRRQGLREALAAVSSGVVGTLVIWKLDRLSRQGIGRVGEFLRTIGAVGGRLVSVRDGLDTSDTSDRRLVEMLAEHARSESENLGLRVRSAKTYLRSTGRWIGGAPPYGLAVRNGRLEVDPATGPVVRQIADRILGGSSLTEVARWLNDTGVPSPRGVKRGVGSIAQLLRPPSVAGLLPETLRHVDGRYSGVVRPWIDPGTGEPVSVMAPGQMPLISPSEQLHIAAVFEERTKLSTYGVRRGRRSPDSEYLLTGLLRCAGCAERMSKQGNSYRCQSVRLGRDCGAPAGAYRPALDAAVVQLWMDRLDLLEDGEPLRQAVAERLAADADPDTVRRRASLQAALADERAALTVLEQDHYLRRTVDRSRFLLLHDALTRRICDLESALERVPAPVVDTRWLRDPGLRTDKWSGAGVRERRGLLKLAIDTIAVSRGRRGARFVADDRLVIGWAEPLESSATMDP